VYIFLYLLNGRIGQAPKETWFLCFSIK
jgi:hypothetical protein